MKGEIFMTRKQIDLMRETRLWLGQVIVPATVLVMTISPKAREVTVEKFRDMKESAKRKFKREERS